MASASESPMARSVLHAERTEHCDDLAGCAALVGAAGNQTLGEALYLGKPVLAMPEERHHEQLINAHFLKQMRVGTWTTMESSQSRDLARFLDRLAEFLEGIWPHRGRLDGTQEALAVMSAGCRAPKRLPRRIALRGHSLSSETGID